jgi:nucleotide-binding universal stress UspA family protein
VINIWRDGPYIIGDPTEEILKLIETEKIVMIVMASHGEK